MTPERYARIKQLFNTVVELDETARDDYLRKECVNDPELRAEVESLLRHDDSRTIIRSGDTTVADFSRQHINISGRGRFFRRLKGWGALTKHLGPRGFLALGALISLGLVSLVAFLGLSRLRGFQKELQREALNEIVDGKVLGLRMWLSHEVKTAESWARSNELRERVSKLVELADQVGDAPESLKESPLQQALQTEISALAGHEEDFSIWDRRHLLIADNLGGGNRIGSPVTPWGASILARVFEGQSRLFAFSSNRSITDLGEDLRIEPHVAVVTPIRDANGQIIAALQIHDDDSREKASQILQLVRFGRTGETYVFSHNGLMLSDNRSRQDLEELGLIPDGAGGDSIYPVYLRDPGGDLTAGFQLEEPLESRPLTRMARLCISGHDGDDMEGYRDYRGVQVFGAWRWIDELEIGVATELDVNEADPVARVMIWEAWMMVVMFGFCIAVALYSYYSVHQLREDFDADRILGQYRLEKQIGEGGMGRVFKAQHQLLRRPTAIKLLKPELIDEGSRARFEREARLVSQLDHTNTIRVYDYGVSPAGLFYFVMEYIDGVTLKELVQLDGPIPASRAVFLLRQVCYSLREAHELGVVHRDLKPGNIMVCRRGGEFDLVKVLDFGLVKQIDASLSQQITTKNLVAGTPQYMAPERLSDPITNDPRSDLYSFGAVAFYLLTARDAVTSGNLGEILYQIVNTEPVRPSQYATQAIPKKLDELVLACLSKDPRARPASAREIIDVLKEIEATCPWSQREAEAWWAKTEHLRQ